MLLKEICIQNSTESKKKLGYCGCHIIQSAIQTRVSFKVTKGSQGCLEHCLVKCSKSSGLQRVHLAWALFPACDHQLIDTSDFPFPSYVNGKSLAASCDCYLWSYHGTSLSICISSGPLLMCNLVSESVLHAEESSGEVTVAE